MEIRIKDLTKIFPGDPKRNIRDTIAVKGYTRIELTAEEPKAE